ncbi:hypothetical protein SKAU_G00375390 [Synaphobranchus kaupii]|uniref:Uncharacterized protein n=1 Tax=Synaphobranchus kaupii TaxID=118154 RepID=A0A9Q1EGU4_SYNKA|nr:hypothetical protein SKAU_G00375390 [Synaphobranchus kaupii]
MENEQSEEERRVTLRMGTIGARRPAQRPRVGPHSLLAELRMNVILKSHTVSARLFCVCITKPGINTNSQGGAISSPSLSPLCSSPAGWLAEPHRYSPQPWRTHTPR